MNIILDLKITKLGNESDISGFTNNSHLNEKIKTLTAKAELEVQKDLKRII